MKNINIIIALIFILCATFLSTANAQQLNESEKIPLEKMAKLNGLIGTWNTVNYAFSGGNWKQIATSKATFSTKLKGKLISEDISDLTPPTGFIVETFISYDQYRNTFRLAAIDDTFGLMDIYEGDFVDDKTFQLTNIRAGTNFPLAGGGSLYFRLTFSELNNEKREFLVERSADKGQNWSPMNKNIMSRIN